MIPIIDDNLLANSDRVTLLQLTDPHLFDQPSKTLLGVNTWDSFNAVIDAALSHTFDAVVLSGDVSQDYSSQSYRACADALARLNKPTMVLPGNHDELVKLREHLVGSNVFHSEVVNIGGWGLHMLDSTTGESPGGRLGSSRTRRMLDNIQSSTQDWQMLFLHHNPVKTGSAWLDNHWLADGQEFLAELEKQPKVRGVAWGHVHQEMDLAHQHIRLMASPACCIQFLPNSQTFALDTLQPGFRLLHLYRDGSIETQVYRLPGQAFIADPDAQGY
ncbi:3',5'-cyclic-AMP phosphodiesterase [Paraferrimonas sedimenticola]|uniref:3',5'-cyclic-AMP phosphodiesterase n=1 Tax=Paraferrimonas sedimenticola TaxID=375674 RepID=UPI001473D4D7|nr:3',5'-cyclic-AMP phosphodiesterase [Paraferrimonas sedimenticola]